jgi:hypothetical protein
VTIIVAVLVLAVLYLWHRIDRLEAWNRSIVDKLDEVVNLTNELEAEMPDTPDYEELDLRDE